MRYWSNVLLTWSGRLGCALLLAACGKSGGTSASGSGQDFTVSGTIVSGNGTVSGGTTGVLPLDCPLQIRDREGSRTITFVSQGTCGSSGQEASALAKAGFSGEQIALVHQALGFGPGYFASFPAYTIGKNCEFPTSIEAVQSVCVGMPKNR